MYIYILKYDFYVCFLLLYIVKTNIFHKLLLVNNRGLFKYLITQEKIEI